MSVVQNFRKYAIRRGISWRFSFRLRFLPEPYRVPRYSPEFEENVRNYSQPADISGQTYFVQFDEGALLDTSSGFLQVNTAAAEIVIILPPVETAKFAPGTLPFSVFYKTSGDTVNLWIRLAGETIVVD